MKSNAPPRFVVAGMYRSGSTKLYNILRETLVIQNPNLNFGHYPAVQDFIDVVKQGGALLLKQHDLPDDVISLIKQGDVKVIITIRNPMEAMVSLCSTFGYTPEEAVAATEQAIKSAEQVGKFAHIFRYETATSSNPRTIRRYLKLLGIRVSMFELTRLSFKYNRQNSRQISRSVQGGSGTSWDNETLFHPDHIGEKRRVDEDIANALGAAISDRSFNERFLNLDKYAI